MLTIFESCSRPYNGSMVSRHRPHAAETTSGRATAAAHATASFMRLRWHSSHSTASDSSFPQVPLSSSPVADSQPPSTANHPHPPTVSSLYSALVSNGVITRSEEQLGVVGRLDGLLHDLKGYDEGMRLHQVTELTAVCGIHCVGPGQTGQTGRAERLVDR